MLAKAQILLNNRRSALTALLLSIALPACTQTTTDQAMTNAKTLTPDEQRWKHKFRGLGGGQLFVDAFGEKYGVVIFNEKGQRFFARASLSARGNSKYGYGAEFGVPITLRATWREGGVPGSATETDWNSKLIGDVTVPVAERIPDTILDEVRKSGGGFRLKLRLKEDDLLVGWDIETRPGYDPKKLGLNGQPIYVTPVHSFVGGDFQEAKIHNGQVERKGWYIDKKTGQKIETDF
jgi:hypothetical protein